MSGSPDGWRLPRGRKLPLINQVESAECGLACVCMIAGYYGHQISLASARVDNPTTLRGATLQDLVDVAASYNLSARAVRCEPDELAQLQLPAILHWDMKHFVVLKEVTSNGLVVHDPATGVRTVAPREVERSFTGVALELAPTQEFQPARERRKFSLKSLVSLDGAMTSALWQAIILSIGVEVFVLATPLLFQIVIDEVIVKGDVDLLALLAIGFTLLAVFKGGATLIRSLTLQYVSNALSYDMRSRLFRRLVRLPTSYLQRRSVGDVQQRFAALDPIKQFLGGGAILALFDGLLSIITGILMLIYAWDLALAVFAATGLYALIRLLTVRISRRRAGEAMRAKAKEQSKFLETLRAFGTIKSLGIEPGREMLYRNVAGDTLSAEARLGNVNFTMLAFNQALFGVVDVVVIVLAARQVLNAEMTVGVLTAFIAYKTLFTTRVAAFIEQFVAFRLLDVQLEFISDIALAEEEANLDSAPPKPDIQGAVALRNGHFRYGRRDREILSGASIDIRPGEFVAIAGVSGAGKTTLLKLLAGLLDLRGGEIRIDDIPIQKWGKRALRSRVGLVMQDDVLLTGSIAENIALFDPEYRYEDLLRASKLACVDEDILALPMGFHSLVGDLGSTLSGGQKQRIMLARALYHHPKILILDEGTSHVDVAMEMKINAMLKGQTITRIVAAHRPDTLNAADRVFVLRNGHLRPRATDAQATGSSSTSGGPALLPGDAAGPGRGWRRRHSGGDIELE